MWVASLLLSHLLITSWLFCYSNALLPDLQSDALWHLIPRVFQFHKSTRTRSLDEENLKLSRLIAAEYLNRGLGKPFCKEKNFILLQIVPLSTKLRNGLDLPSCIALWKAPEQQLSTLAVTEVSDTHKPCDPFPNLIGIFPVQLLQFFTIPKFE